MNFKCEKVDSKMFVFQNDVDDHVQYKVVGWVRNVICLYIVSFYDVMCSIFIVFKSKEDKDINMRQNFKPEQKLRRIFLRMQICCLCVRPKHTTWPRVKWFNHFFNHLCHFFDCIVVLNSEWLGEAPTWLAAVQVWPLKQHSMQFFFKYFMQLNISLPLKNRIIKTKN